MMKKRGFTLIELLITMTFISVISVTVITVYVIGYSTFRQELASSIVQSDAQTILDSMLLDVKNGMLIEATYLTYTTDIDTIIIRVPALDVNKRIIYSGSDMVYDRVVYDYSSSDHSIHKIIYADPLSNRFAKNGIDNVLDKNILLLNFTYDPDPTTATLVTAKISSEQIAGNKERNITVTGMARLRNHI